MKIRHSALTTAQLLLINAKLYESERDKEITRYRFSLDTLRRISGRTAIRDKFKEDVEEELLELGWIIVELDNEFAIIEKSRLATWVKLSSKRLKEKDLIGSSSNSAVHIQERFDELFPPVEEDPAEE